MNTNKEIEYIVEKILDKKMDKNEAKFLVKWQGYPENESTWEPLSHLAKVLDMVDNFEKNNNKTAPKSQSRSKAGDNKLIGKKRSKPSQDNDDGISSDSLNKNKKALKSSNITDNKKESDKGSEKQPSSISSSSSEQKKKDVSIKSPERSIRSEQLKHMESVNNEFRDSSVITSPKMVTRTMSKGRKTEDDKIIENVYEK